MPSACASEENRLFTGVFPVWSRPPAEVASAPLIDPSIDVLEEAFALSKGVSLATSPSPFVSLTDASSEYVPRASIPSSSSPLIDLLSPSSKLTYSAVLEESFA